MTMTCWKKLQQWLLQRARSCSTKKFWPDRRFPRIMVGCECLDRTWIYNGLTGRVHAWADVVISVAYFFISNISDRFQTKSFYLVRIQQMPDRELACATGPLCSSDDRSFGVLIHLVQHDHVRRVLDVQATCE